MRSLLVGALSATLIGCTCATSPHTIRKTCTSTNCSHRTAGSGRIDSKPMTFRPNLTSAAAKSPFMRTPSPENPSKSPRDDKTGSITGSFEPPAPGQSIETAKTVITTKMENPDQPAEGSDPVLKKAKTAIAAKMEDPSSAKFEDMKRAMRSDTFGQSIDTICGHVKGKTASGDETLERPFLYLVKDDVAFVDFGNPLSVAANAYRAICISTDFRQQQNRK